MALPPLEDEMFVPSTLKLGVFTKEISISVEVTGASLKGWMQRSEEQV